MFLKSIRLKNLKCFEDLELSFEEEDGTIRKWTILLGENGTGKSTLLKAIALITSGSDALSDLLAEPDDWLRYGEEYCEISAVLAPTSKPSEEREIKLRIEKGNTRSEVIVRNSDNLELLDRALKHTPRNYFVVGFGASRRLSAGEGRRQRTSVFSSLRAQSVATLFDPDATLNPLESWAMDLDYIQNQTGIETVRRVLSDFLPGIKFDHIDKKKGQLLFKTPDGLVPLHSLSDGYQSAAAWVGDLLYRVMGVFEDYQSPLEANGLLLIDEVDLHLHLKWQRDLLSFLDKRFPNFQLIVSTHSLMTVQQAGPDQLHYLTRERQRIRIEQFVGNPRNLLLSQLLLTDAFGIESDESLEVQAKKARYTELNEKKSLSAHEQTELKELTTYLTDVPTGGRTNLVLQEEHAQLLRDIQKGLKERRS